MALKRNETYPGRFNNPTTEHPQGAFKNCSASGAQDGSYLEQQWANDWDGFFGRLLTLAGVTPNGNVDTASSSQYYDALKSLFLQRTDPFGDIKSDGSVPTALANLGLGAGAPAIGIPFFWPLSAMPNTVMPEWADMVFLKFNGTTFSATAYPKLALVFPALTLPEARGEFLRIWDDGRGVDSGRALLSAQSDDFKTHEHKFLGARGTAGGNNVISVQLNVNSIYTNSITQPGGGVLPAFENPGGTETRPRNIAFNFLVRAK